MVLFFDALFNNPNRVVNSMASRMGLAKAKLVFIKDIL